ncbi:MAG: hypothetical protein AB7P01_08070 [Bacteroidia bacterium]
MLIIGTGGLAKDIAGNISRYVDREQYVFYNDIEGNTDRLFLNNYKIIKSKEEAAVYLKNTDNNFIAALANPLMRMRLSNKFMDMGGVLKTLIFTDFKAISDFTNIGNGCLVQYGVIISSNTIIGEGTFINCGVIIGHDITIGKYCSFGPGVRILGGVEIGEFSYIGCNAVIMPGVKIGKKVRIGVGKIIEKDVPDNSKII